MDVDREQLELKGRVRARFPEDARRTDEWLLERGYELDHTYAWVEAFADPIAVAVRMLDRSTVRDQTDFFAVEFRNGSEHLRALIDVSYAENVMWDLDSHSKAWAWPYIADTIKDLYRMEWGEPQQEKSG